MSVRSIRGLAEQRRGGPDAAAAPGTGSGGSASSLESAVPTEIVVFYTTVIAACESVLRDSEDAMTPFRFWLFVGTLLLTVLVSGRMVWHAAGTAMKSVSSAEWWTATVAFTAWGLVVPGSFLYTWLDRDQLVVTIATVTAGAGLLLGASLGPNLNRPVGAVRPRVQAESLTIFERDEQQEPTEHDQPADPPRG